MLNVHKWNGQTVFLITREPFVFHLIYRFINHITRNVRFLIAPTDNFYLEVYKYIV